MSWGEVEAREMAENAIRESGEDLTREELRAALKGMTETMKNMSRDEAQVWVKKELKNSVTDLLEEQVGENVSRVGGSIFSLSRDAEDVAAESMIKKVGKFTGIDSLADVAKYAAGGLIAWKMLAVNQAQDPDACKTKCLAGTNGDQTQYATESDTPDPNCPSGQTAPQCKMYCSTTDPGACSRKNNLARGSAKCGGMGMLDCTADAAGGAFDNARKFWDTFGTSLTYLGFGLFILFILVFVYYTAKTLMTTNVNKAISVATRGEVTQVIGKKRGGARKFKLK